MDTFIIRGVIPGAPQEARWTRPEPRSSVPLPTLERLMAAIFPRHRLLDAQPLAGGFRNTNLKLRLDTHPKRVVLRLYEHDPVVCQKEIDLLHLVSGSVPVPEVIYAAPNGFEDLGPFILMSYVDGMTLLDLRRTGDADAIAEAAFSAGETLAAIARHTFSKFGWLAAGPTVTAPLLEGSDPMPRFVDLCLASERLQERVDPDLRARIHELVWAERATLAVLGRETCLVHGDFSKRNLLVREVSGRWSVAAVLDWEFSISSTPLADIGHFLRYGTDVEPHFCAGFLNSGGTLSADWRYLAKLVDIIAVCECLTHEIIPAAAEEELIEILRATVARPSFKPG